MVKVNDAAFGLIPPSEDQFSVAPPDADAITIPLVSGVRTCFKAIFLIS